MVQAWLAMTSARTCGTLTAKVKYMCHLRWTSHVWFHFKKLTVQQLRSPAVDAKNVSRENCFIKSLYWTESKVILGNILNFAKRFHVFVAKRLEQIRSFSTTSQWRYIEREANVADITSRGISSAKVLHSNLYFYSHEVPASLEVSRFQHVLALPETNRCIIPEMYRLFAHQYSGQVKPWFLTCQSARQ